MLTTGKEPGRVESWYEKQSTGIMPARMARYKLVHLLFSYLFLERGKKEREKHGFALFIYAFTG